MSQQKAPQHLRVLMNFSRQNDNELIATADAVIHGLTNNKSFPTLPVELPVLEAARNELSAAVAAQMQGGTTATAEKNKKRHVLIRLLRKLASYVQAVCDDDMPTLLSSGFQPIPGRRSTAPLAKPSILSIDNGHTTQLIVRVTRIANAKSYQLQFAVAGTGNTGGDWLQAGLFTTAGAMKVTGLTPGTNYLFQVRAVGGSTGYSDWSDTVAHMSL